MNALLTCVFCCLLLVSVAGSQNVDHEALRVLRRSGSLFWINRQRLNKFKPHRTGLKVEFGPLHDIAKAQYGREFQRKLEELQKMNMYNEI